MADGFQRWTSFLKRDVIMDCRRARTSCRVKETFLQFLSPSPTVCLFHKHTQLEQKLELNHSCFTNENASTNGKLLNVAFYEK